MDKRRQASYLLEPPAGEVVRELLDEIDELKEYCFDLQAEVEGQALIAKVEGQALIAKHEGEWIDVKERLPETFVLVIICQEDNVFTGKMLATDDWESGNGFLIQTPDYWMPMPKPPGGEK